MTDDEPIGELSDLHDRVQESGLDGASGCLTAGALRALIVLVIVVTMVGGIWLLYHRSAGVDPFDRERVDVDFDRGSPDGAQTLEERDLLVPIGGAWRVTNPSPEGGCTAWQDLGARAEELVYLTVGEDGAEVTAIPAEERSPPLLFERIAVSSADASYVASYVLPVPGTVGLQHRVTFTDRRRFEGLLIGEVNVAGVLCQIRRETRGVLVDEGRAYGDDADGLISEVRRIPDDGFQHLRAAERFQVPEPIAAATARDALDAYLQGAAEKPPVGPPYIELRGDGRVFYGWKVDGDLAGAIELAMNEDGTYSVIGWMTAQQASP